MKKIICLLLALIFVFSFVACGVDPVSTSESSTASTTSQISSSTQSTTSIIQTTQKIEIVEPEDNAEFSSFVQDYLLELIGDDVTVWNYIAVDPANFGYIREDVVAEFSYYYGLEETKKEAYDFFNECLESLHKFDKNTLNSKQKLEYEAIEYISTMELVPSQPDCTWGILALPNYINQFGGHVAEFASSVENFSLHNEQNVIDLIDMTKSTTEAFETYVQYAKDRTDLGFVFSDFTIDKMIEFLTGVEDAGDDYYLYSFMEKKISSLDFLDDDKKAEYIIEFCNALTNNYMTSVSKLKKDLEQFKGYWTDPNEGYVAHYGDKCTGYSEWKLAYSLGYTTIDVDEYGKYVKEKYESASSDISKIVAKINSSSKILNEVIDALDNKESLFECNSVEELIEFALKYSSSVVKPLENKPEISVKYTDETAAKFASYLAYYSLSPYDAKYFPNEYITLNPLNTGAYADLISTIAHEGYPGHLYAHCYAKQQDVPTLTILMGVNGPSEGWAQYAAYQVLKVFSKATTNKTYSYLADYIAVSEYVNYLYSCYIDYLVNYKCLNASQLAKELKIGNEDAIDMIHFCDEQVAIMAEYGYSFARMVDAHKQALVGAKNYNEAEFNSYMIRNGGLFSFEKYDQLLKQYIEEN